MKLRYAFIILLGLFLASGCGQSKTTTNELYFKGEGIHWAGTLKERYTETWTEDKSGRLHYHNSMREGLILKYKGPDPGSIDNVRYELTGIFGSSGDISLNQYGYSDCGQGGGEGIAIAREDDVFTLTLTWGNGDKEAFELRAPSPSSDKLSYINN